MKRLTPMMCAATLALIFAAPALASFTIGGVVSADGLARPGALVRLYVDNLETTTTTANSNGYYAFLRVTGGHYYQVNASKCISHQYRYGWTPSAPTWLSGPGDASWPVYMTSIAGGC